MPQCRPIFNSEFKLQVGLDLETFYGLLSVIAISWMARSPSEGGPYKVESGLFRQIDSSQNCKDFAQAFDEYSAHYCQSPDDLTNAVRKSIAKGGTPASWVTLKTIRQRPILRTNDGRCIVIDPIYFAEQASAGPLFAVLKTTTANKCFEDIGHTFERYASSILRRMYPKSTECLVDRLTVDLQGTNATGNHVQVADACLSDPDTIVLFEMKASWLPDERAESPDPNDYISVVRDRYAISSDRSAPKGAGQLARSIAKIATGELSTTDCAIPTAARIVPVLICYDGMIESGTHPWFLAEEFRTLLQPDSTTPDGNLVKGQFRVSPLIILTIEMLENLEASIENFSLVKLLLDYSVACPDRVENLRTYTWRSDYGKMLFANRNLAKSAVRALEQGCRMVGLSPG